VATKVEKRKVRKQQTAKALGIDSVDEEKSSSEENWKTRFFKKSGKSENYWKWFLFFINALLLMFIYKFK
jgi:hypothetical protein